MNKIRKIFWQISQWYRRKFIEIPDGYGDPVILEVEQFQQQMNDKPETVLSSPDNQDLHKRNQK